MLKHVKENDETLKQKTSILEQIKQAIKINLKEEEEVKNIEK